MKIAYESADVIIFESALFRTATTLLRGDDYLLLVDPNWLPLELDTIADKIEEWRSDRQPYLLFTHSDYDHIIGYRRFPGFRTIGSFNFTQNPTKGKALDQIWEFDDSNYILRDYSIDYPQIDLVVRSEAERWRIGKDAYIFCQARGHNADGIITFNQSKGILIVGDYLSNIEFPYLYDSVDFYHNTLDRLEAIIDSGEVRLLISGHGDSTTDQAEMRKRLDDSHAYLADLEAAVRSGRPFDFDRLMQRFDFPQIMRKFHEGNLKLMQEYVTKQRS